MTYYFIRSIAKLQQIFWSRKRKIFFFFQEFKVLRFSDYSLNLFTHPIEHLAQHELLLYVESTSDKNKRRDYKFSGTISLSLRSVTNTNEDKFNVARLNAFFSMWDIVIGNEKKRKGEWKQ